MADMTMQKAYDDLSVAVGEINHLSLDESILDQPQLFGHCAAWCAHYASKVVKLKRDAEVTDARVYTRIRNEFTGDKKPTEALLANLVMVDQESLDAHNRYLKAVELSKKWDSLLDSFKQRSYALGQYVNWRSGDYIHEREGSQRTLSRRVRQ